MSDQQRAAKRINSLKPVLYPERRSLVPRGVGPSLRAVASLGDYLQLQLFFLGSQLLYWLGDPWPSLPNVAESSSKDLGHWQIKHSN